MFIFLGIKRNNFKTNKIKTPTGRTPLVVDCDAIKTTFCPGIILIPVYVLIGLFFYIVEVKGQIFDADNAIV